MQLKHMMENIGRHHSSPQQLDDDRRRYSSPSSSVDIESYSPYSPVANMPPPPMMQPTIGSTHDAVRDNNHNGGASSSSLSSSSLLQWPDGLQQQVVRPIARTITNDTKNDCHYSATNARPMNSPMPTSSGNYVSISSSCGNDVWSSINSSSHNTHDTMVQIVPEKDRFLYILFDILSSTENLNQADNTQRVVTNNRSSNGDNLLLLSGNNNKNSNEESIAWLPHGRGFTIVNKPLFESETLARVLPNVKYATFVRRLRRYKFIRISSGAEMGAYYHPYFRRDQPHLLPLINTIDEIPIERYDVDVNDVVTYDGGAGGNVPINSSKGSTYIDHPPSNLEEDNFSPTTTPFSPIPEAAGVGGSVHSASLSLGTITPSSIQLTTTPSSSTKGGSSSGKKDGTVVNILAAELHPDPSLFDNILLPFIEEDDDDIFIDDCDEDNGNDLISSIGGGVDASSSLKSAGERKITEVALELLLPHGDVFAVQQQMLQQESHPAIGPQLTPDKDERNLDCNTGRNTDNVAAADMKSFPQMLREISKAKRLESMTQKKQCQKRLTTPVTTSFLSANSSNATTVINIPTASMEGGPDMKNRFQYRRMVSATRSIQTHHTMRESMWKHQHLRRMSRTDANMERALGEESKKYQYHRNGSASSMTFHRKGTSDVLASFYMDDRKGKYHYRRNKSCDGIIKKKSNRLQHYPHRNTNVSMTSGTFDEQLRQQQPIEVQLDFVSVAWNKGGYRDEEQQEHHYPHNEKLHRHRYRSRKNGVDPYAELWRQVDAGGGGFQYQPPANTSTLVNNVPDDDSHFDLDMDYSGCYTTLAGNHNRNQPQRQHQVLRLPQSPPASPSSHQNNDYEQIVEALILGDDDNVQKEKLMPTMLYNHQQKRGSRVGGRVNNEELPDDLSYGCDDFDPLPLQSKEQFPSFRRRSTL